MSQYNDGRSFNEFDSPWCEICISNNSYEECQACLKKHGWYSDKDSERETEKDS